MCLFYPFLSRTSVPTPPLLVTCLALVHCSGIARYLLRTEAAGRGTAHKAQRTRWNLLCPAPCPLRAENGRPVDTYIVLENVYVRRYAPRWWGPMVGRSTLTSERVRRAEADFQANRVAGIHLRSPSRLNIAAEGVLPMACKDLCFPFTLHGYVGPLARHFISPPAVFSIPSKITHGVGYRTLHSPLTVADRPHGSPGELPLSGLCCRGYEARPEVQWSNDRGKKQKRKHCERGCGCVEEPNFGSDISLPPVRTVVSRTSSTGVGQRHGGTRGGIAGVNFESFRLRIQAGLPKRKHHQTSMPPMDYRFLPQHAS